MSKVWFITGVSRGFGREWATAALERGDKVAATARKTETLKDLVEKYGDRILPISLDVQNREDCFEAMDAAFATFGRVDVVVNNAGYGQFGFIEELSEKEAREQMETNVFGALWVTQAALPHLRKQGSGHFLQISSIGGISAFAGIGIYNASKWALEGFSQSLAQEVASFGIKVTLVEPSAYDTDWSGASAKRATPIADYAKAKEDAAEARKTRFTKAGSAPASAAVILKLVDMAEPPLRLFLGEDPLRIAKTDYASRLESWEKWQPLAVEAQGNKS